jgi:hypothetical protein
MLMAELGLAPATKRALGAAGIKNIDGLQRPAKDLLAIKPITGAVLYDIACRLQAHNLGLWTRTDPRQSVQPTEGDLEMLRLRVVDGLALRDIASICGVSPERVRQRLNLCFGLSGDSPAAVERRRTRVLRRSEWEQMIALRLWQAESGLTMAVLLRGFADGPLDGEARAAIGRMETKGLLTVVGDRVRPTEVLRLVSRDRTIPFGASKVIGAPWWHS